MQVLLEQTLSSGVVEHLPDLISTFQTAIVEKDLQLYSTDSDVQELFEQNNWYKPIPVDLEDRLAIFDSNIGWNKADRGVTRNAVYEVNLSALAAPSAELILSWLRETF
jgi:hypothetical protein